MEVQDKLILEERSDLWGRGGLMRKPATQKDSLNWALERYKQVQKDHLIKVSERSRTDQERHMAFESSHMARPWGGNLESVKRSSESGFRLISTSGFDCWGSLQDSTNHLTQMAFVKALASGVVPQQLRFMMSLPDHGSALGQHLFESSLNMLSRVCERYGVSIDGGDTFDGEKWRLSLTVGGPSFDQGQDNQFSPGDYLLLTRPLGYGALWGGRLSSEFQSQWIEDSLRSDLIANFEVYAQFQKSFQPNASVFIEEWGFLYHSLRALPGGQELVINFREVPRWQGVERLVNTQTMKASLQQNWQRIEDRVVFSSKEVSPINSILWDPLSSGALVFGVRKEIWKEALHGLKNMGFHDASLVGCVRPKTKGHSVVLSDWSPS